MKKTKQLNDATLVAEILETLVCEKSDLIWVVPFSPEVQEKIIKELFQAYFISEN